MVIKERALTNVSPAGRVTTSSLPSLAIQNHPKLGFQAKGFLLPICPIKKLKECHEINMHFLSLSVTPDVSNL